MNCSLRKLGCRFSSHHGPRSPRLLKGVIGVPTHEEPPWDRTGHPDPGSSCTPPRCGGRACLPTKRSRPCLVGVERKLWAKPASRRRRTPGSASGVCVPVTPTTVEPVGCVREPQGQRSACCPAPSTCPAGGLRGSGLSQGQGPGAEGRARPTPAPGTARLPAEQPPCHSPPGHSGKRAGFPAGGSPQTAAVECHDIGQNIYQVPQLNGLPQNPSGVVTHNQASARADRAHDRPGL